MRIPAVPSLAALLLCATAASPQAGRIHVTELGRRVLAKTDQIVRAEVIAVRPPFRGVSTARLAVKERIHGFDRAGELTLLFIDDFMAPDAFGATLERSTVRYERERKRGLREAVEPGTDDAPGEGADREPGTGAREVDSSRERIPGGGRGAGTGVRLAEGEEGLFFLRRQGVAYRLIGFVRSTDPLFESKRERLLGILRLEAVPALDLRVAEARRFFVKKLAVPDVWARANAARELRSLAERYPETFAPAEVRAIAQRLHRENEPPILASLERALRSLDPEVALAFAEADEERMRAEHAETLAREKKLIDANRVDELRAADVVRLAQRFGRASTSVVAAYLRDEAAIVRERAAQALAELGGPSAREPLRAALEVETATDAATAMVYALGVKGDPGAVPTLASRLDEPALERPVLHALARIGTPRARAVLEAHRAKATAATAELIDALLREEFPERS